MMSATHSMIMMAVVVAISVAIVIGSPIIAAWVLLLLMVISLMVRLGMRFIRVVLLSRI